MHSAEYRPYVPRKNLLRTPSRTSLPPPASSFPLLHRNANSYLHHDKIASHFRPIQALQANCIFFSRYAISSSRITLPLDFFLVCRCTTVSHSSKLQLSTSVRRSRSFIILVRSLCLPSHHPHFYREMMTPFHFLWMLFISLWELGCCCCESLENSLSVGGGSRSFPDCPVALVLRTIIQHVEH